MMLEFWLPCRFFFFFLIYGITTYGGRGVNSTLKKMALFQDYLQASSHTRFRLIFREEYKGACKRRAHTQANSKKHREVTCLMLVMIHSSVKPSSSWKCWNSSLPNSPLWSSECCYQPLVFLFQIHLSFFSCSLILLLPQVTKTEFLLTMSIQYQPDRWWE